MAGFFLDALTVSAAAGFLALAVLAARPMLRRRYTARLRCAVWWVLAIWLCIPLKFTLPAAPVQLVVPQAVAHQTVQLPLPRAEEAASAAESGVQPETDALPVQGQQADATAVQPAQVQPAAPAQASDAAQAPGMPAAAPPQTDPASETPGAPMGSGAQEEPQGQDRGYAGSNAASQVPNVSEAAGTDLRLSPAQILVIGWAVTAVVILSVRLGGYCIWRRKMDRWNAPIADRKVLACADRARRAAGCRQKPPLVSNPKAACPMVVGLLRPSVLMPEGLQADAQTAMMLVHEYTHLARRDIGLKFCLVLASSLHWFNPAVWLMVRAAGQDIELACDEQVLRGRPDGWRDAYSRALLAGACAPRVLLATHFAAGKKRMMQRLAAVFERTNKKRGALVFTALVLIAALGVSMVACTVTPLIPGAGTDSEALAAMEEPWPEGAVEVVRAEPQKEILWKELIALEPVEQRVSQSDMPVQLLYADVPFLQAEDAAGGQTEWFFDESRMVGLRVEPGMFEDMPHLLRTEDGGETWQRADTSQAAVASPMGSYRDLILHPFADGAVVLEYATGTMDNGGSYIYHLLSTDQGRTWYVPRIAKEYRQAGKLLYQAGVRAGGGLSSNPLLPSATAAGSSNREYTIGEDGTIVWDKAAYFAAPAGTAVYAAYSAQGFEDPQRPGVLVQTLFQQPGCDIRLVYEGLSQLEAADASAEGTHYYSAGSPVGTAGSTEYGEGVVLRLYVNGLEVPAGWLYRDYTADLAGRVWASFVPPQLLEAPAEFDALLKQADPTAVQLAYNFAQALLNSDENRLCELIVGQDAAWVPLYGERYPFEDLTGFVCSGAAVSAGTQEQGAPVMLTLDIAQPGKTGLSAGRHVYCLRYHAQQDVTPESWPAAGTVAELIPQELYSAVDADALQTVFVFRAYGSGETFASGEALLQEHPAQVLEYLMVAGGDSVYSGEQLHRAAAQLLGIENYRPPQTDRDQNEEYWFVLNYDAAADTYTLADGFGGSTADVAADAMAWHQQEGTDGTVLLTRWDFRDTLHMIPCASIAYTLRANTDGTWQICKAEAEESTQIYQKGDARIEPWVQDSTGAAMQTGSPGQVTVAGISREEGRIAVSNMEAYLSSSTSGGAMQFLPDQNTVEVVWYPGSDTTQAAVYDAVGTLLCLADDFDGEPAVREGYYTGAMAAAVLQQARDFVRAEYSRQGVQAPIVITAVPADRPGDQLSDSEIEQIVRTVSKGVSWFHMWSTYWLADQQAEWIVVEQIRNGYAYQQRYLPCLEFPDYAGFEAAADSVLARDEAGRPAYSDWVVEWNGKAYLPYGSGGIGGPMTIEPVAVEIVSREPERLEVVICEQYYKEGIPQVRTSHVLTVQDGNWVMDGFYGQGDSTYDEARDAWNALYEDDYLYDSDFQALWASMGLDTAGRAWALSDDAAWNASGLARLNFVQDPDDPTVRWLQVANEEGTALYRLQDGHWDETGSQCLLFASREQNGETVWYEEGHRPMLLVNTGEPGDNLVAMAWTTEEEPAAELESYFYYREDELAHKEARAAQM